MSKTLMSGTVIVALLVTALAVLPTVAQAQQAIPPQQKSPFDSFLPSGMPALPGVPSLPGVQVDSKTVAAPGDLLQQAQKSYKDGNYNDALKLIAQAQDGIRARHAAIYQTALPPVPAGGWVEDTAGDPVTTLGTQVAGGLSIVTRGYKGNDYHADITYIVDSPMMPLINTMSQLIMAFANAGANPVTDVKGYKAIYFEQLADHARNKKEIRMIAILQGNMIIIVTSPNLPKDTLFQFANIIDFDKLKAIK